MPEPTIVIDPAICHGKPTLRGSRVPVNVVLSAIAGGDPIEQIADDYGVTIEAVRAAVAFAAEQIEAQSYHALRG